MSPHLPYAYNIREVNDMMCGETAAAAVTALASALSCGRSADDIALLGTVFTQLGDTLITISAFKTQEEQCSKAPSDGQ